MENESYYLNKHIILFRAVLEDIINYDNFRYYKRNEIYDSEDRDFDDRDFDRDLDNDDNYSNNWNTYDEKLYGNYDDWEDYWDSIYG
jgi:hypothetical protein